MDIFDQKQVLESFHVIVDNREQDTPRAKERYSNIGAPIERATLDYGDYTFNAMLPTGTPIYDTNTRIKPTCVIERKMDLDELAQCFTRNRERFTKEFKRAKENNARVYLLVENASYEKLINGRYKSRFNPKAFIGSVTAFMVRYNMGLLFCREESTPALIREILYRDLKERLERGEYD